MTYKADFEKRCPSCNVILDINATECIECDYEFEDVDPDQKYDEDKNYN